MNRGRGPGAPPAPPTAPRQARQDFMCPFPSPPTDSLPRDAITAPEFQSSATRQTLWAGLRDYWERFFALEDAHARPNSRPSL